MCVLPLSGRFPYLNVEMQGIFSHPVIPNLHCMIACMENMVLVRLRFSSLEVKKWTAKLAAAIK